MAFRVITESTACKAGFTFVAPRHMTVSLVVSYINIPARKREGDRKKEYKITSVRSGCSAMQRCRVCSAAFVRGDATPAAAPERKYTTLPIKAATTNARRTLPFLLVPL